MTPYLLSGLCLGQAFIGLVLLAVYAKVEYSNQRADKMLLVCQELADRLWESRPGNVISCELESVVLPEAVGPAVTSEDDSYIVYTGFEEEGPFRDGGSVSGTVGPF